MPGEEYRPDELPDAIAIASNTFADGLFGALIAADYRSIGAAQLTVFDPASGIVDFVFAHRPAPTADAQLAIVHTTALDPSDAIAVQPRQGSIDEVLAADLDLDDDIDLLTIHLENAGFSIIRQQPGDGGSLVFGEPEFYTLELELSDVILGDRNLIAQVLSNLLDNAIKYAPRGSTVDVVMTASNTRPRARQYSPRRTACSRPRGRASCRDGR